MTEQTKTDKVTFELPKEVRDAIDAARDKITDYLKGARDRFEQEDADEQDNADLITDWFNELSELADNLDTMSLEPEEN